MQMMDKNVFYIADLTGNPPILGQPERWSPEAKSFIVIPTSSSRPGSDIANASTIITCEMYNFLTDDFVIVARFLRQSF